METETRWTLCNHYEQSCRVYGPAERAKKLPLFCDLASIEKGVHWGWNKFVNFNKTSLHFFIFSLCPAHLLLSCAYFCENFPEKNSDISSQKLAKISRRQNIFTKMVPLCSHLAGKFFLFCNKLKDKSTFVNFNENFDEKFRYFHIFLQAIFSKMQNEHFRRRQYTQLGFIFKSPKDDRSFFYEHVPVSLRIKDICCSNEYEFIKVLIFSDIFEYLIFIN